MRTRSGNRGFTVVEMLVVITVVGFLAAIASPVMSRWVPNQRLKAAARDITSALAQAKAEAIRRGDRVTVLFNYSNDALSQGQKQLYVMFMDTGVDDGSGVKVGRRDALWEKGEEIIFQSGPMPVRIVLDRSKTTCRNRIGGGDPAHRGVGFNTRAMPVDAWNAGDSIGSCTIRLCVGDDETRPGKPCREVKIASAGRVRTEVVSQ